MPEDRTFMMGKFAAVLPGDRLYARNHMWCRVEDGRCRFGFTAYAMRLMQDVYFLDWSVSPGDAVSPAQEVGHIETSKAQSDLFAPMPGAIATFNEDVLQDPAGINVVAEHRVAAGPFALAPNVTYSAGPQTRSRPPGPSRHGLCL